MEIPGRSVDQNGSAVPSEVEPGESLQANGEPQDEAQELSRRERERLVRRRLMLDAARAVFAEKGYAEATLDEIAQRAEFGKGTLYNYFEGGKEEILFAVFDDLHTALHEMIERTFSPELLGERPLREVLEGFLAAFFAFFNERQDQFMVMMKEGHRLMFSEEPEQAAYIRNQGRGVVDALIPPIQEAKRRGLIRDIPASAVAHMILGSIRGYQMHLCMDDCAPQSRSEDAARPAAAAPKAAAHPVPPPAESARFLSTFLLDGLLSDQVD
jgi:AcrR family transcriptional regulator